MVSTIGQVTAALLEEIVSRCQVLSSSSMILMVTREAGLIGQSAICPLSTVPQNIRGRVAQNLFILSQYAIWNKNINKKNKPQKFPLFIHVFARLHKRFGCTHCNWRLANNRFSLIGQKSHLDFMVGFKHYFKYWGLLITNHNQQIFHFSPIGK